MGQCMREEVGTVEVPAGHFALEQPNLREQIPQIAPRNATRKLRPITEDAQMHQQNNKNHARPN